MRATLYSIAGLVSLLSFSIGAPLEAQSPSGTSRIDASAFQKLIDENLDLRREQAQLETETGDLRRKNAALLLDVRDLERKRDQLTLLISQLKTPDENRSAMAKLQSEKLVLIREIERLRQAAVTAAPPPVVTAPVPVPEPVLAPVPVPSPAAGSDLFRKVEKENAELRMELAKAKEIARIESASREEASKSEAAMKAEVDHMGEQINALQNDLETTRRRETVLKAALKVQAKKAYEVEALKKKSADSVPVAVKKQTPPAVLVPGVDKNGKVIFVEKKEPTVPETLAAGRKLLSDMDVRSAEQKYLGVLERDPNHASACYNLGVIYDDYLKNPRKALKYYRRYIEVAPHAPDVATVRSWIEKLDDRSDW